MIVRILGEGQLSVDDAAVSELNELDSKLSAAVDVGDEAGFRSALDAMLSRVRAIGTPLELDALQPSELILPQDGATMEDVRKLLTDDGLIPG
jgi:PspA-Associated protein